MRYGNIISEDCFIYLNLALRRNMINCVNNLVGKSVSTVFKMMLTLKATVQAALVLSYIACFSKNVLILLRASSQADLQIMNYMPAMFE